MHTAESRFYAVYLGSPSIEESRHIFSQTCSAARNRVCTANRISSTHSQQEDRVFSQITVFAHLQAHGSFIACFFVHLTQISDVAFNSKVQALSFKFMFIFNFRLSLPEPFLRFCLLLSTQTTPATCHTVPDFKIRNKTQQHLQ